MSVLNPFVPENWIVATLLATAGQTTTVSGVVVPADATAIVADRIHPARDGFEPVAWPFILYSPYPDRGDFEEWAEEITLAEGDWCIRQLMREDLVESGTDIEDFNLDGYIAIAAAFDGVSDAIVNNSGTAGIIHGCSIKRPHIRLYGEVGRRVSEMGVIVHITST